VDERRVAGVAIGGFGVVTFVLSRVRAMKLFLCLLQRFLVSFLRMLVSFLRVLHGFLDSSWPLR
jgi:hypothetical protein